MEMEHITHSTPKRIETDTANLSCLPKSPWGPTLVPLQASPPLQQEEIMLNQEKLAKVQAQVAVGGKGTAPRKKVVHRIATAGDIKLQFSCKKLWVNNMSSIDVDVCPQIKEE